MTPQQLQRAQHRPGARPARAQRSRCGGGALLTLSPTLTQEHCYSDMWALGVGKLLSGAKQLNITANGTVVDSAELVKKEVCGA